MARVPLVGRLFFREYVALYFSFMFLIFEFVIRIITLALPSPIINFCYNRSRSLFKTFASSKKSHADHKSQQSMVRQIREADGFVEMCALFGYQAEEHIVQTKDGYLLGLHRISRGRDEAPPKRGSRDARKKRGVVYLHHGLMMNSEVWVCNLEPHKCVPFVLADKGFDVWLGNNRGNKYSKKSIYTNSQDPAFWNFSMDEFAMHDIPDSIAYVLATTKSPTLSYIGFSQGTAQAFAALSIHPDLNEVVDVFIALAPAMSPSGLHNSIVDAMVKASPDLIYLFFGRKSILNSTMFWQSILYPPIFVGLIDKSLTFLFNWSNRNMKLEQKLAAYSHLYSFTSVKSVVHWFQIIRNKSFQMYDDDVQQPVGLGYGRSFYKVAKFPTRNITTPCVLLYGGSDSLVDISVMLSELPLSTVAREIPHYEHLDFLWGDEVDELVIPHVLETLENYSSGTSKGDLIEARPVQKLLRFNTSENQMIRFDSGLMIENGTSDEHEPEEALVEAGGDATHDDEHKTLAIEEADKQEEHVDQDERKDHPEEIPVPHSPTTNSFTSSPSSTREKTSRPSTPTHHHATPAWPAWLGGKKTARSDSISSTPSTSSERASTSSGGVSFGADGLRLGVSKPAPSSVVTTTLGDGEDLGNPGSLSTNSKSKKRKATKTSHN